MTSAITGAMLYQLSYMKLEAGQVWVQFIPIIRREWYDVKDQMSALQIKTLQVKAVEPLDLRIFLGFICDCMLKLLQNCEDHFHLY